ncbi:MAG: hypothetical protein KDE20_13905 [Caldilineaceae bacterium]|nr:hypothetical protein [Caldilineaceae bacterium]
MTIKLKKSDLQDLVRKVIKEQFAVSEESSEPTTLFAHMESSKLDDLAHKAANAVWTAMGYGHSSEEYYDLKDKFLDVLYDL